MRKLGLVLLVLAVGAATVEAQYQLDPPGKPLKLYSQFSNDGYSETRGVVFTADQGFQLAAVGHYNNVGVGGDATFYLYEDVQLNGQIGGNLVAQATGKMSGGLDWHTLPMNYTLKAGKNYELSVGYNWAADGNHFYDFDPQFFGDQPFKVGPVTVVDGTMGHETSNFVMPRMELIPVPEPAALALLALGALVARRR